MDTSDITIIIPCYNQSQYLDECIESVINQTYINWECIIIDDGSTDNTKIVGNKWAHIDKRISYQYKDNGGLSSARNKGLELANTQYILPLDADDKISCDYIEKALIYFLNNPSTSIVYSSLKQFGISSNVILSNYEGFKKLLIENFIFCSAIYKREDALIIGGYDVNMVYGLEDWEFWINMIGNLDLKVHKMDFVGFHYRIKEESMLTTLNTGERKKQMLDYVYKKHLNFYQQKYDNQIVIIRKLEEYNNFQEYLIKYHPFDKTIKALFQKIILKLRRLIN